MQHPDLEYLIQCEILSDRLRKASNRRLMPESVVIHPFRRIAGSLLITMGTRIAATPHPITTRPAIGRVAIAGRIDR